jgi:hypothetical protein
MVIQHWAFDQEFACALPGLTIPSCTRHHRRMVDIDQHQSSSAPSPEEIGVIARAWRVRFRAHRCGPQISSTANDPSVLKLICEHYGVIGRC